MPGVMIAADRQYHDALRSLFLPAGTSVQHCFSAGEARRALCSASYDLLIINAPLSDEYGKDLALQAVDSGTDVILLCSAQQADKLAAGLERYGVFVLAKPMTRQQASFAMQLIRTSRKRLEKLVAQNRRLTKRLEEARIVSQAKCLLVLHQHLSEDEAHRFIEKRAMDDRISSREAAQQIVDSYTFTA